MHPGGVDPRMREVRDAIDEPARRRRALDEEAARGEEVGADAEPAGCR